jgi:hypothetical protein
MADFDILGIDCGGTKVLAQSASFNSESDLVSPGEFHLEKNYSDHPNWNSNFFPVHLDLQRQEFAAGNICLTEPEMDQGDVIVETINSVISEIGSDIDLHLHLSPVIGENKRGVNKNIGLCFPGIKNKNGVVIMANGPRIPNLLERIPEIDSLYSDSDSCVLGEWKSSIGKMENAENAIYIGGGTGIADGVILNGKLIDFNERDEIKRSWELIMENGKTVESCLSPKGMIDQWNLSHSDKIERLDQLSQKENANPIFEKAAVAFSFLIQDRIRFFKTNHAKVEKIVIGQRLGAFISSSDNILKSFFESKTDIPIAISSDRRTAALGAAWKKICL